MNFFFDTSALIKLYHNEDGSEQLAQLIQQHSYDLVFTISDLTIIELHSAIFKRVRTGDITSDVAAGITDCFKNDFQSFFIVEIDKSIKNLAIEIIESFADTLNMRTLDALQLASAITVDTYHKVDFFLASDKSLIEIAEKYFNVLNPMD